MIFSHIFYYFSVYGKSLTAVIKFWLLVIMIDLTVHNFLSNIT